MATAKERHSMTKSYLVEVKSRMGSSISMLEENEMKMLHMNTPLGGWREWMTLTYDHNVLADLLVRENEDLRTIKKDLEKKIQDLTAPHFPHHPPPGYPDLSPPCPNPPFISLGHQYHTRSAELEENWSDEEN